MKILIVDDNTANLMATEYMFLGTGYTVFKAKNGKECLEAVKKINPDLILLDVNLPDINGISICKMLKENAETRNIYIIMMSGLFTDSDNQALGLETGADGYITRPFQKRELHARVSSLLRIKVVEDELRNALEEKKESEEQLKKYKEHLEELVASRTTELGNTNKKLKNEIREHKKARESIQDQFIFLKNLIDSIPNPISFKDCNSNLIQFNNAFEETFDTFKAREDYYSIFRFENPELKQKIEKIDEELLTAPATKEIEVTIRDRNDNVRDYILKKSSFINSNGEIAGILGIATEITDRKALELQLQESLRKEREVNEFQAKFISTVSHEFRTPLTSILGAADLLEMFGSKWDREKFSEYISRIQKAVEYMTELINDLLIIRKADSGNMTAKCSSINLLNLCTETVEIIKSKFEATHSIALNYNSDMVYFTQDEKLLKMILLNLLSNAVKYSPEGGEIVFGIDLEADNILFRIRDNGIGIAEADMKRLFEPFYRGNNAKKIPGTGLGLSIVKRSVELCGGKILIDSKLNQGTSITVFIPY